MRTAIDLADAEGIDTLSMRRIAAEMGSGTTSPYRHITNKNELIELMVDAVYEENPLPHRHHDDWHSFRNALPRHPWLAQEASRRPALGPNALGVVAAVAAQAGVVATTIDTYMLGSVATELAEQEAQRRTGMARVGRPVCPTGSRFWPLPHFNRRTTEADDPDTQARCDFGLDCLLTGIAAALGCGSTGGG